MEYHSHTSSDKIQNKHKHISQLLGYMALSVMVTLIITSILWIINMGSAHQYHFDISQISSPTYPQLYICRLYIVILIVKYLLILASLSSAVLVFVLHQKKLRFSLFTQYLIYRICLFVLLFASFIALLHTLKILDVLSILTHSKNSQWSQQTSYFQNILIGIVPLMSLIIITEISMTVVIPRYHQFQMDKQQQAIKKKILELCKIRKNSQDSSLNYLLSQHNFGKDEIMSYKTCSGAKDEIRREKQCQENMINVRRHGFENNQRERCKTILEQKNEESLIYNVINGEIINENIYVDQTNSQQIEDRSFQQRSRMIQQPSNKVFGILIHSLNESPQNMSKTEYKKKNQQSSNQIDGQSIVNVPLTAQKQNNHQFIIQNQDPTCENCRNLVDSQVIQQQQNIINKRKKRGILTLKKSKII